MARAYRRLGLHLALAAMVLRAILPAGWMPVAPENHSAAGLSLVLCTGAGPVRSTAPLPHKHADLTRHEACPFAAAVAFALPGAVILAPSRATAPSEAPRLFTAVAQARLYTPQSPRAPPLAT